MLSRERTLHIGLAVFARPKQRPVKGIHDNRNPLPFPQGSDQDLVKRSLGRNLGQLHTHPPARFAFQPVQEGVEAFARVVAMEQWNTKKAVPVLPQAQAADRQAAKATQPLQGKEATQGWSTLRVRRRGL